MFKQITKKRFIEQMVDSHSVLVSGGFTSRNLIGEEWSDRVIDVCEQCTLNHEESEVRSCAANSNSLTFFLPDGSTSKLYFNESGAKTYWNYGNIFIVKTEYEDTERMNFCIYITL